MSRFDIEILPAAEAEIRDAFLWYFERNPMAADEFRSEVLDAIERLGSDALLWPESDDKIRRCVLTRFPCSVIYVVETSTVTVLAVAHQRRNPEYWRAR